MQPSTVVILGSTGSIGTQGLDVISRHLDRFTVTGLAAGGAHVELLAQQAAKFHVPTVAIFDKEAVPALREALEQAGAGNVNITAGPDAVIAMAGSGADVVLNGITGSIGLEPSIAALQAGSQLALANKNPWWPADTCCLARRYATSRSIRSIPNIPPSGSRCVPARTAKCPSSSSPRPAVRSAAGSATK